MPITIPENKQEASYARGVTDHDARTCAAEKLAGRLYTTVNRPNTCPATTDYAKDTDGFTYQTVIDLRNRRDSLRSQLGTLEQKLHSITTLLALFE